MKLSELGERGVIEKLSRFLPIGDDAACIKNGNEYLVMSTDVIYEKTHIPVQMAPGVIGKFVASINISDIAAVGGKPEAFLLSCSVPDMEYDFLEGVIKGADKQCRRYGVRYVGGDTKQNESMTFAGFCMGRAKKPVLRSGARKGDVVAVTGTVGDAPIGFDLMDKDLDGRLKKRLVKKAFEPEPRVKEGLLLGRYATAMTDLSDGLSVGLHNIAKRSGVGMEIHRDCLPISRDVKAAGKAFGMDYFEHALHGGGDYQLLFTIPRRHFEKVGEKAGATEIGVVTSSRNVVLWSGDSSCDLGKKGYEHFRNKE